MFDWEKYCATWLGEKSFIANICANWLKQCLKCATWVGRKLRVLTSIWKKGGGQSWLLKSMLIDGGVDKAKRLVLCYLKRFLTSVWLSRPLQSRSCNDPDNHTDTKKSMFNWWSSLKLKGKSQFCAEWKC